MNLKTNNNLNAAQLTVQAEHLLIRKEVDALFEGPRIPHRLTSDWSSVVLYGPRGDATWNRGVGGLFQPTKALMQMPATRELLASLPMELQAVRLSFLAPGCRIPPHTDLDLFGGWVRLHYVVQTDDSAEMTINGETWNWREGELWYGDFGRTHSVINMGSAVRIHIMIDGIISFELINRFPSEVRQQLSTRVIETVPASPVKLPSRYVSVKGALYGRRRLIGKVESSTDVTYIRGLGTNVIFGEIRSYKKGWILGTVPFVESTILGKDLILDKVQWFAAHLNGTPDEFDAAQASTTSYRFESDTLWFMFAAVEQFLRFRIVEPALVSIRTKILKLRANSDQ